VATRTFAEVLTDLADFGDNKSVTDVLGKTLEVVGYEPISTRWGDACRIHALLDGENISILTWSGVLKKQLDSVKDKLPLVGSIQQVKNYYTFA